MQIYKTFAVTKSLSGVRDSDTVVLHEIDPAATVLIEVPIIRAFCAVTGVVFCIDRAGVPSVRTPSPAGCTSHQQRRHSRPHKSVMQPAVRPVLLARDDKQRGAVCH